MRIPSFVVVSRFLGCLLLCRGIAYQVRLVPSQFAGQFVGFLVVLFAMEHKKSLVCGDIGATYCILNCLMLRGRRQI